MLIPLQNDTTSNQGGAGFQASAVVPLLQWLGEALLYSPQKITA